MKSSMTKSEAAIRSRFDFSKPTLGRFYERYQKGHSVTLLDHDPDAQFEDPLDSTNWSGTNTREVGKDIFISHIQSAGLKIAEPLSRERIDFLIYRDGGPDRELIPFAVQIKTSIHKTFSLHKNDLKMPRSLLAYVWNAKDYEESSIYAITYKEALHVLKEKGYAATDSWMSKGGYSVTDAGTDLKEMLEPYRMTPERWQQRLQSV